MCEIVIIFMGKDSMEKSLSLQGVTDKVLYLPFKSSPKSFNWPVLKAEVYLLDTSWSSRSFVQLTVLCLLGQGATAVHYFDKKNTISTHKRN